MVLDKSQLRIGAVLSYINIIVSLCIGFITVPFIVKSLGTSEFGVYSLTASLVGYLSILDFGMHNVVVRYVAKYNVNNEKKEQANFLATALIIYSIISIIVIIIGSVIYMKIHLIFGNSLSLEEINISRKLFVIMIINLTISLPGAVFPAIIIAHEKFVFSKTILLVKMLFRATLILFILYLGSRSIGLILIDLVLNLSVILINAIYCYKELKIKIKLESIDFEFIQNIINYTFYVFLASVTEQINWRVDSLILGILTNTTLVAVSAVAMQLITYFRTFTGSISGIFLPRTTKMVAQGYDNRELTNLLIKVGRYQLIIIGLLLTGFIFVGKQFIILWVGEDYLLAYSIFLILSISLVIPSCQSIGINILEAKKMHKFRSKIYLAISVLNIIITIFLVKVYGIVGAAVGTAFSLIVGNVFIMNWYYIRKVGLDIKRYFKEVFGKSAPWIILCNFVCYMVYSAVNFKISWTSLLIQVIFIVAIYGTIIFVKVLSVDEKEQIKVMYRIKSKQ